MPDRMTADEYQRYLKTGRMPGEKPSKYRNRHTEFNGKTYASQREANRAAELQLMVRAGEIMAVCEQVPFDLPGGIKYIADFVILLPDGTYRVEDAKGVKTDVYKLKKRLMRKKGIEIVEV